MPRTGRRRSLTIAAALAASLAVPAIAHAETFTVTGKAADSPCTADLVCGTLADAAATAQSGDVFNVAPAVYEDATFTVGGITIAGAPNFAVNGTLTFSANSGGVSKLQKAAINQATGIQPGVVVSGTAGLEISDSAIRSANDDGVQIREGTTNKIVRSVIATTGQATAAVHVTSADTSAAPKALTMDSSFATGGVAGVSAETGDGGPLSGAGPITVDLRHVTAAGSTRGLLLDASQAISLTGVGNITSTVTDSILQNGKLSNFYPGLLGFGLNSVTETYTRTLMDPFDSNVVFAKPASGNYRLRAGSPAINAGGVTAGESTTDIDGNDRSTAPTDQGGDEFTAASAPPGLVPVTPPGTGDGIAPEVVITRPRAGQKIKLVKRTTRTNKTTKKKTTTSKRTKIRVSGTSKDASGMRAVVLTIEKTSTTVSKPRTSASSAAATTTATKKCKFLNATKGIVLKRCTSPVLLAAKLATDGTWTFSVKSTIKLGPGKYRVTAVGLDKSGKAGNSAKRSDAIRTFTLTK